MDLQSKPGSKNLKKRIKLLIGLGNPGIDYQDTYHNVGADFADFFAGQNKEKETRIKSAKLFEYSAAGNLIAAKSLTFMNESGSAVKAAMTAFKLKPREIMIAHDDSDLFLGKSKFSFGRGTGGHKGIENAIKALRTKDFWRLRIGIRPPEEKIRAKAGSFVLKKIKPGDKKILESLFREIAKDGKFSGI